MSPNCLSVTNYKNQKNGKSQNIFRILTIEPTNIYRKVVMKTKFAILEWYSRCQ